MSALILAAVVLVLVAVLVPLVRRRLRAEARARTPMARLTRAFRELQTAVISMQPAITAAATAFQGLAEAWSKPPSGEADEQR